MDSQPHMLNQERHAADIPEGAWPIIRSGYWRYTPLRSLGVWQDEKCRVFELEMRFWELDANGRPTDR